jgi:hypothetical protein
MEKQPSATSIVAWAIVNLGVVLPVETLFDMSPHDPLYVELMKAWRDKEEREDRRTALLCTIIANVQGNKCKIEDFLPRKVKTTEEQEAELKANLMAYSSAVANK